MQTILQKLVIEPLCYCCCSRVFAGQGYVHPSAMFVDAADACSDLLPSRHFSNTHCHHWTHNSKTIIDYVKVYQYIQWQPAPNNNATPHRPNPRRKAPSTSRRWKLPVFVAVMQIGTLSEIKWFNLRSSEGVPGPYSGGGCWWHAIIKLKGPLCIRGMSMDGLLKRC